VTTEPDNAVLGRQFTALPSQRQARMAEKPQSAPQLTPPGPANVSRRGSAFRGGDAKDPMVELTERAKVISQEAGTKVSAAMRDMISAAAGIAGFAVESARDLVQYMVRRGQMTQEEADKLIREAEASHMKRPAAERAKLTASKLAAEKAAAAKKAALAAANLAPPTHRPLVPGRMVAPDPPRVTAQPKVAAKPAARPAAAPARKPSAVKPAAKSAAKTAKPASKPTAGKPAAKKPAGAKKRR
jgi:polyhydroxyalkanoate synthesis regulator phasin